MISDYGRHCNYFADMCIVKREVKLNEGEEVRLPFFSGSKSKWHSNHIGKTSYSARTRKVGYLSRADTSLS